MKIRTFLKILLVFLISTSIVSCKSTKFVPEGEYLLTKNSIKCDNSSIDEDDLASTVSQKTNKKILSLVRFHLAVYNIMKSGKEKKWKNKIANVVGEEPVIYDDDLVAKTISNMKSFMASQSYYRAEVSAEKEFKKNKKARVKYTIMAGPSYTISSIKYDVQDSTLANLFYLDTVNTLIKVGNKFNTDTLKAERERIVRFYKLNGYYYFSVNNVHFLADTLQEEMKVGVTIKVYKQDENDAAFQDQSIKDINIYSNYDITGNKNSTNTNMFSKDGIKFIYDERMSHKTSVFLQSCFFEPGDRYSIRNVEDTYSHLSSLQQFRLINIKLTPHDTVDIASDISKNKFLDVNVYLAPMKRQSYTIELEGSNTSGNIGMSGVISYRNRNLFRGAQIFSAKANLSFQTSALFDTTAISNINSKFFNTLEYGGELKLNFPKLLLPFFDNPDFVKKHNPKTTLSISFNYQNRPDYTRTIANISFGYNWKDSKNKYITHYINPIELYWVKILEFNESFKKQIQNLYIRYSYEDQFLTVLSYDLVFNNQNVNVKHDFSYLWFNIETCGNLVNGICNLANPHPEGGNHTLWDTEIAQYVKTDIDYRFYKIINEKSSVVWRAYFGIGIPYGNSTKGLPFVKRYFIGGANDIRAWQVRTIGPGSYSNEHKNCDQIADMKIMLNMEYRFPLISVIQGALFIDAGNIWAVDKNDNREGALFSFSRFYKEFALGTGFGLRLDFSFLVLRFDIGIPVYNPSLEAGSRWWESFTPFQIRKFTLNFGIGYPF